MGWERIAGTVVAAILIAAPAGFAAAQAAGGPAESQAKSPGSGTSAPDRPRGAYGPGGVPRQHETTTEPSEPPDNAASAPDRPAGDHGPGGVPQNRETTSQPSGRGTSDGGGAPPPAR